MVEEPEYEEYDEWKDFAQCEVCDKNLTNIRCPQLRHDLGDKGTLDYFICEDCCEDYLFWNNEYLEDGCIGDCNSEVPKIFFENRLKKLALKLGLEESKKYTGNFLNKSGTILFGNCTICKDSYPSFIETSKLIMPSAIYPGKYATFVINQSDKINAYDIEWIQEVKKLFSEMKENWDEVTFYSYGNYLLIRGYYNWALVVNTEKSDYLLDRESTNFQDLIINGIEFFKIHLQRPFHISFERLTDEDFELFCLDLLKLDESIKNVNRIGGTSGDDGIDILATEEIKTFSGIEVRKWQVQCKKVSSNLNFDDISKEIVRACANNFDGLLFIVSSDFTSPTKRQIVSYNDNPKNRIKIRYISKNEIADILLIKPELLKKWCNKI